jgi:hypothetical protein
MWLELHTLAMASKANVQFYLKSLGSLRSLKFFLCVIIVTVLGIKKDQTEVFPRDCYH